MRKQEERERGGPSTVQLIRKRRVSTQPPGEPLESAKAFSSEQENSIFFSSASPTPRTGPVGCLMRVGFTVWAPLVKWHGGLWLVSEMSVGTLS